MSRRGRPAKPPLSRESIAAAGLRVVDSEGLSALTMRRVARELDTGAASLYVYVDNRDDLLAAMIDSELAAVVVPTEGSWQEKVTALVRSQVAALTRHRSLAVAALGAIPISTNVSRLAEHLLSALLESGIDRRTAAWAVDLIGVWTSATAAEQTINDERAARGEVEAGYLKRINEYYDTLDPAVYPTILGMRDLLLSGGDEERAEWGINVILNGILATPVPSDTPPG
ncbi:TetR/AcrR family transcriptional regulator [Cellulomonas fimi]|uniref:TetR/AcrR family transcriptional regulator n=1 Tax=Cellulomonas sp. RIT-PI-Y TaxID=3035297 RepID=UPI0021DA4577